eukprot:COSAG04_NODE_27773_length_280_cov_0.574586_1_plen_22_part_10
MPKTSGELSPRGYDAPWALRVV